MSDLVENGGQPRFAGAYAVRDDSGGLKGMMVMVVDPSLMSPLFEGYVSPRLVHHHCELD